MTDIPLAAPGAPAAGSENLPADAILLWFGGSARQRRWTVLIRLILLLPQLAVGIALGIAVTGVEIISWFAALALGRLPAWAARFLTGWLCWYARMYGYLWLLTDRYPPFSLDDADYPVRVATAPGRLSRLAVFFRLILVIPAWAVLVVATGGIGGIVMFVIWLIVLISGRMPDSLQQAVAAILRMQVRYAGYLSLLTGTYPWWGLFGDKPEPAAAMPGATPAAVPPPPGAAPAGGGTGGAAGPVWGTPPAAPVPGYGMPGPAQPGYAQPGYAQPGYGAAGYGVPAGPQTGAPDLLTAPPDPRTWRLFLPGTAKNLVIVFLVLGVVQFAASAVSEVLVLSSGAQRINAISTVQQARTRLANTMNTLQGRVSSCGTSLPCITSQEGKAGQAFAGFGSAVRLTAMPNAASATAAASLEQDAARISVDFGQLSRATSPAQYQQTLAASNLQQTLAQFNSDYQQLGVALGAVKG